MINSKECFTVLIINVVLWRLKLLWSNFFRCLFFPSLCRSRNVSTSCSPWKKCSFDACWSSFPVEIFWPLCCRGTFFPFVLSFSVPGEVVAVCPDTWFNRPVGLRGVTVSSRIRLSWKKHRENKKSKMKNRTCRTSTHSFVFFLA